MAVATAAKATGFSSSSTSFSDFPIGSLRRDGRKLFVYRGWAAPSTGFTSPRVPKFCIRNSQKSTKIGAVSVVKTIGRQLRKVPRPAETLDLLKTLKLPSIKSEPKVLKDVDDQKVTFPFYATVSNLFCDTLESALLWACYGYTKPTNQYMLGNYAPVEESAPQRILTVKGYLPECLNGVFIRVGPNPKLMPLAKYHWFDGDGMLHGLKIKDGEVTYACRYVRTSRLKQEEYWGAPKFRRSGDMVGYKALLTVGIYALREKLGALDTSKGDGTANTSLAYHNGTLLALVETDMPYAVRILDNGDFETISRHDFDKKLDHPFTAHPKIDPDTGEVFSYGYLLDGPPYLTYNVISKDGQMGDPIPITLPGPKMMHDLAITDDYVVFMDCSLNFDPEGMIKKDQFVFIHSECTPIRFGILPKYAKDESQMRWFEFTPAINFHIANGWQEGDEIVLTTCRMSKVNMLSINDASPRLHEYRINLKTGETSERTLGEFDADFPRINENYIGRKNRYVYTAGNRKTNNQPHSLGIAKYDLTKEPEFGKEKLQVGGNVAGVFWFGDLRWGSEPVFVPRNPGRKLDSEDDGYILCHVFDENTGKSEVLVVDAKTMSADPIAVIEMPSRVPYGFHSVFVSEEQLRLQKHYLPTDN